MVTEVVFLELSGATEMQLVGAEIDSFEDGDGEYFLHCGMLFVQLNLSITFNYFRIYDHILRIIIFLHIYI